MAEKKQEVERIKAQMDKMQSQLADKDKELNTIASALMKEQSEKEEIAQQKSALAKQIETLRCQHANLKQVNDNL